MARRSPSRVDRGLSGLLTSRCETQIGISSILYVDIVIRHDNRLGCHWSDRRLAPGPAGSKWSLAQLCPVMDRATDQRFSVLTALGRAEVRHQDARFCEGREDFTPDQWHPIWRFGRGRPGYPLLSKDPSVVVSTDNNILGATGQRGGTLKAQMEGLVVASDLPSDAQSNKPTILSLHGTGQG